VLALAGLLIVGLVVSGTGVIHLTSLDVMIRDGARALGPFTYLLVGALAYLPPSPCWATPSGSRWTSCWR
jgi:hypothetical protein